MKSGIELIKQERERQISKEGWNVQHDDFHTNGELAKAGACYACPRELSNIRPALWPFEIENYKPEEDRIRELEKAGALIAAEIDRLQRKREDNYE